MLDWVSIRDPIARATAKAAYCEKHPLPEPTSTACCGRPEARSLCFGKRSYPSLRRHCRPARGRNGGPRRLRADPRHAGSV